MRDFESLIGHRICENDVYLYREISFSEYASAIYVANKLENLAIVTNIIDHARINPDTIDINVVSDEEKIYLILLCPPDLVRQCFGSLENAKSISEHLQQIMPQYQFGNYITANSIKDSICAAYEQFDILFGSMGRNKHVTYYRNLQNIDLSKRSLAGFNLAYNMLRRATLRNCNFNGSDLNHAMLAEADLNYASFESANLSYANCIKADFRNCSLNRTDVKKADFTKAHLDVGVAFNCNLYRGHLQETDFGKHLPALSHRGHILAGATTAAAAAPLVAGAVITCASVIVGAMIPAFALGAAFAPLGIGMRVYKHRRNRGCEEMAPFMEWDPEMESEWDS